MRRFSVLSAIVVAAVLALRPWMPAPAAAPGDEAPKRVGLDTRIPWTTSKVVGTPDPPDPYRLDIAYAGLKFDEPLATAPVPGSNRLAIAERMGKIHTFENHEAVKTKELLIDIGKVVYGIAFHPKFADNGLFYVTYILSPDKAEEKGTRVSSFKLTGTNPPQAKLDSETVIIEWPSGGHNGGCLRFGPDGMLYISTGDASGIADERITGQDITDLAGSILRIDVDRKQPGLQYAIPADNPFVNTPKARGEIWAYGIRQMWKFSFDSKTGTMWGGEIGQDLWEMVHIVVKGGNYGWSVIEGVHPFRPERPKGPTEFVKPIVEHAHSDFRSIVGGFVYHGSRQPEFAGAYLYADYDTGRVWMLRYDGSKVSDHRELADSDIRIVAWGQAHQGELYMVDYAGGQLHRLAKAPPADPNAPKFPRKLSETGLFADTAKHIPAPGLIPYSVNAELWSDGAIKERFLALPGNGRIEFDAVTYPQPSPGAPPGWRFPDGTVAVKTFSIETEPGNPASRRRLETRLLHFKKMAGKDDDYGAQYWFGYTYLWNDAQTDAELIEAKGADREYLIKDAAAPGGSRKLNWHFPSRTECTLCHTVSAKYVLGVNTLQMNRDHDYGGGRVANQLDTLNHIGVFTKPLPTPAARLPKMIDYRDSTATTEQRARSYLHANCAHCHRKWGGGNAEFQLIATMPMPQTNTVMARPGQGSFNLNDPRLLVPGDPARSMILHRMQLTGLGRMPHIASKVVDEKAVELVRKWIAEMPAK